ncbi:hypothetical protein PMAYCL1PPCAC_14954, partial [Pristionchus mayeri]
MTQGMIMADYCLTDGSCNVRMAVGMLIISSIFIGCGAFMSYASANIVQFLHNTKLKSANSIRLQRKLFVLLCAQTVIPLMLLYTPCILNLGLPLIGIDSTLSADLTPLSLSLFLPVDGLATIFLMKDYRRAALELICC